MTEVFQYRGYVGSVNFSEEDDVFFGKIEGIEGLISYEGSTITELETVFKESVDSYIEDLANDGQRD